MVNQTEGGEAGARAGDRRQNDRRRQDRRTPLPAWRQPWAFVTYGVVGAFALFLIFSGGGGEEPSPEPTAVVPTTPPPMVDSRAQAAAAAPVVDAFGTGDYERLLAQGDGAVGQRVRTQLFCEAMNSVALRSGPGVASPPSVATLADAGGRVPAAECRWGDAAGAPDILLLVPPDLAEQFGSLPLVEQGFVRRRPLRAEVEWVGRSESLALRNVAVLRAIQ